MRFSLDFNEASNLIRAYRQGSILVNERTISHSVIVTTSAIHDWPPARFEDLAEAHFEQIAALHPEIVIFGSGARQRFPQPRLTQSLTGLGIGVEAMDTAAACRTYDIVAAEGRLVAAALLMI